MRHLFFLACFLSCCTSSCCELELLSSCSGWAFPCGGSSCYGAQALGHVCFSCCGTWALQLWHRGSVVVMHRLSFPVACGILVPRPGLTPHPLHCQIQMSIDVFPPRQCFFGLFVCFFVFWALVLNVMFPLSFWCIYFNVLIFFLAGLAKGLSILVIFSKIQILVLLMFSVDFLVSIYFFLNYNVGLFMWDFPF